MLGKTALAKYRLLRRLGSGSNGEVYLAQPLDGGRQVVVKRIFPHIAQHARFRTLFEAEVASMANFHHPYAVQFLEAAYDDPLGPCLAMEYVPGLTLEAILRRHRVMEIDRVGRLLGHFCHALDAAHQAGIIHRDLKPANLMVANAGTVRESLKVMDFGFAGFTAKPHLQLAALTGKGSVYALGTPEYISPDMLRGDRVDGRSDLYSVGVILYEMLTGKLPFQFEDQNALLAAHAYDEPPRFAAVGAGAIPPAIEAVVMHSLAKYPIERQQRARDLVQMFGAALGEDYWTATAPAGWNPPAAQPVVVPATRSSADIVIDPYQVNHEFNANVPERLAAAKIRGFVDDLKGEVLESEPGLIRLRLGLPHTQDAPATGSTILSWFRAPRSKKPAVAAGQEPIELELLLDRPDPSQSRLHVAVAFHPMKEYPPACAKTWRTRCDKINAMLKQYMGGQ